MEKLILIDKENVPNELMLSSALNRSYKYYSEIQKKLQLLKPEIKTEWKYFGRKNGWLLKHIDKKKNLFFLVPYDGFFKLSFTFGNKALSEIIASNNIVDDIKDLIKVSNKYTEGTSVFLPINSIEDALQAIELVKFKDI